MIPKSDMDKAIEIAKKYGVGRLYLIGSSLYKDTEEVRDYDFAVLDVPHGKFFRFYSELYISMPKTVDLIDLSGKPTKFKEIVMREGRVVYDKRAA